MKRNSILALVCCLALAVVNIRAQVTSTSSAVELYGVVSADQMFNGLGFAVPQQENDWEFAAAAAAGAKRVRFDCSWSQVERQSAPPNNTSAGFAQKPSCVSGIASASRRGLKVIVVAAYGPPYHEILRVKVPGGASRGATSINVEFVSGSGGSTLSKMAFPYDYILRTDDSNITERHNYVGALITSITLSDSTHASLTLASALSTSLPAGSTQYRINEILYPSVASWSATDPSIRHYVDFVSFLANDMKSRGVTGEIEIWNEPPWDDDNWDARGRLYDSPPAESVDSPNFGLAAALETITLPAGIKLIWAGPSKSGSESLLHSARHVPSVTIDPPYVNFAFEAFHPYGLTPERALWTTGCLQSSISNPASPKPFWDCYLPGEKRGGNFIWAAQSNMAAKAINPSYGLTQSVTETGMYPPAKGYDVQKARFNIRQFLGYQLVGFTPVVFYSIGDSVQPTEPNYTFVDPTASGYSAKQSFTAVTGLMADLSPISNLPLAGYSIATLPSVISYSGSYPLSTGHIVGTRPGASRNSDLFVMWQRSVTPGCSLNDTTPNESSCDAPDSWMTQPSPLPGMVTVECLALRVRSITNLVTRATVPYTSAGSRITFPVTDDPIGISLDPPVSTPTGLRILR